MRFFFTICCLLSWDSLATCTGYYSIIAPGVIKSNRKYTVAVTLHDAQEASTIRVSIEGPLYYATELAFLQPFETVSLDFFAPKLVWADYKLLAESVTGLKFRNESKLFVSADAGPRIYIQTDRIFYKPGEVIQFRVVIADEHMRPANIREPVRVEILDAERNRVKQFKDIALINGVFNGLVDLSKYPVLGQWEIRVIITGKYNYNRSKMIKVETNVLPKFNVHIETNSHFIIQDYVLHAVAYGRYTSYDKYVAGNVTAILVNPLNGETIQEKRLSTNDTVVVDFVFGNFQPLRDVNGLLLQVELTERHTNQSEINSFYISVRNQRFQIYVKPDSIELLNDRFYRLRVKVRHWNGSSVEDRLTAVSLQYNLNEYESHLDANGEATFELEKDVDGPLVFRYKDSLHNMLSFPKTRRETIDGSVAPYCSLRLNGGRPRLDTAMDIEVSCIDNIPYLIYSVTGHANLIYTRQITLPSNGRTHTIRIHPSMEMVPLAFVFVHYVENGNLRYAELRLDFPEDFENKVSLEAPQQTKAGHEVTFEIKAQPNSYVCVLAVDRSMNLFDASYDLKKSLIMEDLRNDVSYTQSHFPEFPGYLSGMITLTNAHYSYGIIQHTSSVGKALVRVRPPSWNFPETWMFKNFIMSNESLKVTLNIPDIITTWRVTAFSINEVTGFGIVDGPTDVTTVQSFYVELNLPYSVKRGETISISVLIHNYHNQSLDTAVTLYNLHQEFYFMSSFIFDKERGSEDLQHVKYLLISANSIGRLNFLINPRVAGNITLHLEVNNSLTSDSITRKLRVEPEGFARYINKALFVNSTMDEAYKFRLFVNLPLNTVANSELVTLSLGGNSLVPLLRNLNSLLRLPNGCGEQNIVNMATNIFILEYLKSSGKYFKQRSMVNMAKRNLGIGYQQQLSYRHGNGGYSTFGPVNEDQPCIWVTAYVIRYLIKASRLMAMEAHGIESGLEYLSIHQLANGSFPNTGSSIHISYDNPCAVTAFILLTFLEDKKYTVRHHNVIRNGLTFLNSNFDRINDLYTLSIVAKTIQKAQPANVQPVIDKLMLHRKQDGMLMWWSANDKHLEKDIEITANTLVVLLENSDTDPHESLYVLNWLLQQRNERGGFKSGYDTVVGLEALLKFVQKYKNHGNMPLRVQYSAVDWDGVVLKSGAWELNGNNRLKLQTEQLPPSTRYVDISAAGTAQYFAQLSYHYHVAPKDTEGLYFKIELESRMINRQQMLLDVCFTNVDSKLTYMVIIEINLPSGFICVEESQNNLLKNADVERVETTKGDTGIIIYLKRFPSHTRRCLKALADKMFDVIVRQPGAVLIYDYYNLNRKDVSLYDI